ncbi:MAG: L,D-transpeptidase family protein [Pseudomonadota bacterium]
MVKRKPGRNPAAGLLMIGNRAISCRLGRSGIRCRKVEGDGSTPAGKFAILFGYYRRDRIRKPATRIILRNIRPEDGWCDDPGSPNYNKPVKLPLSASHEMMCRNDRLYDVCIVLDYNINPVIRRRGSAIFFHQTSPELKPTEGCVAIDPKEMRRLLPMVSNKTVVRILP